MALHLIKLCVGCESIADLTGWIAENSAARRARKLPDEQVHVTRMMPKRIEEILDGGSLYWVIKGQISCRQAIIDLRAVTGSDGIGRCAIVLDQAVIPVEPRPCRPFQGWRYLEASSAGRDLNAIGTFDQDMPESLRRELAQLGLL
ncbi:MAG: DUF1489 domain-containing protein [Beijerinckiaceae bacterium]|jgi:hypothetical protein|nr:DUF1489 domain-containing protein [Beijerinckiaceae bacterium]